MQKRAVSLEGALESFKKCKDRKVKVTAKWSAKLLPLISGVVGPAHKMATREALRAKTANET